MLWILLIIGCVIAAVMCFFIIMDIISGDWSDIGSCAKQMVASIGIALIGFVGIVAIHALSYKEEAVQTDCKELVSLADTSEISGNVSGGLYYVNVSIDSDEVYSFYYKANNGVKKGKVDAETATIYEKDNCTPQVIEYTTHTKNKMNKVLRNILAFGYGESIQKTYDIYTPKGTILKRFNLDAQ